MVNIVTIPKWHQISGPWTSESPSSLHLWLVSRDPDEHCTHPSRAELSKIEHTLRGTSSCLRSSQQAVGSCLHLWSKAWRNAVTSVKVAPHPLPLSHPQVQLGDRRLTASNRRGFFRSWPGEMTAMFYSDRVISTAVPVESTGVLEMGR